MLMQVHGQRLLQHCLWMFVLLSLDGKMENALSFGTVCRFSSYTRQHEIVHDDWSRGFILWLFCSDDAWNWRGGSVSAFRIIPLCLESTRNDPTCEPQGSSLQGSVLLVCEICAPAGSFSCGEGCPSICQQVPGMADMAWQLAPSGVRDWSFWTLDFWTFGAPGHWHLPNILLCETSSLVCILDIAADCRWWYFQRSDVCFQQLSFTSVFDGGRHGFRLYKMFP